MRKCPKCGSFNVEPYMYQSAEVIKCNDCDFDEGAEFEQYSAEKTSQKAKGEYTPYKTSGSQRTRKK
ncbi:hypothetical protein HYX06_01525 [Candidatus Woesearchaeota archaeon]|nr:hypothetical protein [Candidatus Woesearchaeota archaeon]